MTTIDHAAEAQICINYAHKSPLNDPISQTYMMQAQVHAQLALVNAQREANEQARIANVIAYVTNADGLAQGHKEWLEEELGL